jgi:hypothetical protein
MRVDMLSEGIERLVESLPSLVAGQVSRAGLHHLMRQIEHRCHGGLCGNQGTDESDKGGVQVSLIMHSWLSQKGFKDGHSLLKQRHGS